MNMIDILKFLFNPSNLVPGFVGAFIGLASCRPLNSKAFGEV